MTALASEIEIAGYRPGALGRVVELHGTYYAAQWGFELYFETKVAAGLAGFLDRLDPARDRFWGAYAADRLVASISIDGSEDEGDLAHLRWFIVDPETQGGGLGRRLLAEGLAFSRQAGQAGVYLWTFAGLDAARALYEAHGFRLVEEVAQTQWGKTMTEQRFLLEH